MARLLKLLATSAKYTRCTFILILSNFLAQMCCPLWQGVSLLLHICNAFKA